MKIPDSTTEISFSRIDQPLEAFVSPPNDPLAGLLMDNLPKDHIEITGNIGGKEFSYTYSCKDDRIDMNGEFDSLPFQFNGMLSEKVTLDGFLGTNSLSSTISAQDQGPLNKGQAGEITIEEKINFNPWTGKIAINGSVGGEELRETLIVTDNGTRIVDSGSIGSFEIDREACPMENGFHIKGTLGELEFEEFIIARTT